MSVITLEASGCSARVCSCRTSGGCRSLGSCTGPGQADATVRPLLIMFCMFSLYFWCFVINIYGKHWAGLDLFLG